MYTVLGRLSWLVTVRPWVTLLVLLIVAVALGAGAGLREPPAGLASALPQDSAITASNRILCSLLTSILVAPTARTVRGAYRNARLRSNLRQVAGRSRPANRGRVSAPEASIGDGGAVGAFAANPLEPYGYSSRYHDLPAWLGRVRPNGEFFGGRPQHGIFALPDLFP